jgi:phosphatidylglycerophosphate synthase
MTAGERWAQVELDALRAAGFRPRAWWRFLVASWRRASATRSEQPALTRQARRWASVGLAAGIGAQRAGKRLGLPAPTQRTWLVWWLAIAAMLEWHLGMLEGPDGQARQRLRSADAVTLTRIGLAPFVAATDGGAAFSALVATAGATDFVDGWLARRDGTSRLGRDLDTTADVVLKLAAARAARRAGWLTPATASLLAGCQVAGVVTVAAAYFGTGHHPSDGELNAPRWTAPAVLCGLALTPHRPRAANAVVMTASAATLGVAATHRGYHPALGGAQRLARARA